jgi:hypothetical protein
MTVNEHLILSGPVLTDNQNIPSLFND